MHRLDNGLTVLVREDHSAPVVAVVTRVGTGYLDEPDELVGISHVVEHMLFRGSSRRAAGDMAREVRAAGGAMNAGTLYEATTYQMVLPSSALALGLELQSDALGSPAFHEEELRRELLVIMQEARGKWDNPDAVASELLFRAMFDVHRLRRWRIGTEAGLAKITRNDVVAFHQAMYCPSNMIVVISGDVAPRRALQLADRYFGALPADSPSRSLSSPAEPERVGLRVRGSTVEGVTKTRIDWGWRTPGALHPSTPAVELLAVVLGQGRASRLFRGVREAGGATEIEALHYVLADLGVLAISAHVPPSNQVRAAESIWSEVEALRRGGVLHREVERAKGVLDARALRRTETAVGQARFLAEWQALGDWRLGERHRQSLSTVTPDDVSRVAHEYVSLDRATVVVHYPGGAHEWALERLEQAVREATPMSREPAAPDEERAGRPRHPRPEPGSEAGLHVGEEHGIHLFDLPGGVRLAVKPRRSVTLVSAGIFFRGGIAFERAEEAGITRFMCRASLQGTETRAGERLAVETEALGAVLDASVLSDDIVRWSLSLPSRHFESGLALLADVVLSPSFPSAALERERRAGLQALARVRGDVFRYPLHLFLRGAFPDHPYGFSIDAKQVALCRFTRDEVLRWHRREVLRAKPCVVVVGDVEPTHAATLVARHLSPLQAPESRPEPMSPAWPRGPRDEVEIRAGKQTALVLGFPGPARESRDLPVLQIVSAAVRGTGGRWFEELRGRRALAYSLSAFPVARCQAGAFVAYIATSPDREEEARVGVLAQFDLLVREGLSTTEIEQARSYATGTWRLRHQTNSAQLDTVAEGMLLGRGPGELHEHETSLRSVMPERIREVAAHYFHPGRLVTAILRGTDARLP